MTKPKGKLDRINPNWRDFIAKGRALIHAGELKSVQFVALVREAVSPQLSNEEINQLLQDLITTADAELAQIAAEQAAAAADGPKPS